MGDFNGSPDSGTYSLLNEAGFLSAHLKVHGSEPVVTHKDHKGNEFTADYVFYRCVFSVITLWAVYKILLVMNLIWWIGKIWCIRQHTIPPISF